MCLLISHVCEKNLTLQGWVGGALTWFDGFIRAAPNQFATPALLTTRQYPSDAGDFHGPVFASPLPKVLKDGKEMTPQGYEGWFLRSCVQTVEMCFELDGRLVGVSIVDVGARDTSSVVASGVDPYLSPTLTHRGARTLNLMC